jgi:hypothetical protein
VAGLIVQGRYSDPTLRRVVWPASVQRDVRWSASDDNPATGLFARHETFRRHHTSGNGECLVTSVVGIPAGLYELTALMARIRWEVEVADRIKAYWANSLPIFRLRQCRAA